MPMSYDHVISVIEEFPELQRKESSQNRVSYFYPGSPLRKKCVIQELYLTGNGYLFVGYLKEYHEKRDKKRLISLKSLTQDEFRTVLGKVIESFNATSIA